MMRILDWEMHPAAGLFNFYGRLYRFSEFFQALSICSGLLAVPDSI